MLDSISDSVFWLLLCWVFIPPVFCFFMARTRRRSTFFWVLAGMVLGIIAPVLLYFLPKLPGKKYIVTKDNRLDSKLKLYKTLEEMNQSKQKTS